MLPGSLVIAVAFLGVGVTAGVLIMLLVNWSSEKQPAAVADSRTALYRPEARLWRDRKTSHLVVEMDGSMFPTPERLDAAQRQKIDALTIELQSWLGVKAPAFIQPAAPKPLTPLPTPAYTPSSSAHLSIVEQIDAVLQEKLAGTPLGERSIRISDGPRQTLVVWVGTARYDGLDAVPDPEVKAAIRAAVAEWERRAEKNSPSGQ